MAKWRAACGPDFPLMIDCYMSLTPEYTIALAKAVEPYNIKWIEEFLPPDDYDGYEQVLKACRSLEGLVGFMFGASGCECCSE